MRCGAWGDDDDDDFNHQKMPVGVFRGVPVRAIMVRDSGGERRGLHTLCRRSSFVVPPRFSWGRGMGKEGWMPGMLNHNDQSFNKHAVHRLWVLPDLSSCRSFSPRQGMNGENNQPRAMSIHAPPQFEPPSLVCFIVHNQ